MKEKEIIVGLDIGTTKIAAIVGERAEGGKINIMGVGLTETRDAVLRGVVVNIDRTVDAIKQAVSEASKKSDVNIKVVHVGIAGQHIKCLHHRGQITRNNGEDEISKVDLDRLIHDMHKVVLDPGEEIIHIIPQDYIIDNDRGIKDPIGISGVRLEGNFHIITGQVTATKNIDRCVVRANLEVAELVLEPIASAEAVLNEEEKEAGVALIDIGGGTTDLAIFQDGIIRHTAVIPLGGEIITNDIKEGCNVMQKQAEMMKVKFGSALANEARDNEIISIPGIRGRDPREISVKNLAHIIQARMEEIFEHNNSKQQVAATQAAYCHLLNTKPLIEDGLSVASIAGFAMLGVGFGLQFIPGVGTVAGGMVLSASTALLAGGGGMLTGVGIKDTIDSQSKLNREIGLHSADLNDYQNVIIAKEIRNTNVVMSVVDTALVPVDLAAYRILKNKTPNLPAETIVKNTDRRVEHRGKNTNRQGARRFDDALRSTVDQVENELGKVKKLKLLLKYNKAEYNLNPRDKIYLAAMADMLEQELKKNKGLKGKKLKKKVQKELDKIINKCNGVKGI